MHTPSSKAMRSVERTRMGVLLLSVLATGTAAGRAEAQVDVQARVADLERAIPDLLARAGVTGLSIALVADGRVEWAEGFGVRHSQTGEAVAASTVFEAASLSKPVFAYAVLGLVEAGLLDLDMPLAKYLPYEDIAHDSRYERITARMVLSHQSGFPNWRPRDGQLTITFEPGERFSYSGEGFVYLQRVVEHLTGEPMHTLLARTVLEPFGMVNSSFVWQERFADDVAFGHQDDGTPLPKAMPEAGNAAWSLQTTAPDFARFLSAVVTREGLAAETVRAMLTPESDVDDGVTWGLGWGLQDTDDGLAFWHWGHNDGYRAYTLTYADRRFGVVWFANSDNGMLILDALTARAVGGDQPAVAWLNYETYDAPKRVVRLSLEETIRRDGIAAGLARYHELKETFPDEAFAEDMLNRLGYALLRSDLVEQAIAVFKLNVEMYPDAFNTYDSLGEAYMEHGDLDLAVWNYEKSVELNPSNANGIQMLAKLRTMKEEGH